MTHNSEPYAFLFDQAAEGTKASVLRHGQVSNYKTRAIRAGDQLELEIYPIWNTAAEMRRARGRMTCEAQKRMNERNSRKKMERLLNANFCERDISITLTYAGSVPDREQARRDMQNFVRRVRAAYKRRGLPDPKYIYVMEWGGEGSRKKRIHHHMALTGGLSRDEVEALWTHGRANADRLQPDECGLTGLAKYITKEAHGGKRWAGSRNLEQPKITESTTRLSRRKVERMAEDFGTAAKEILEKLYRNYAYTSCTVKTSEFVAGAYVYARMRRRGNDLAPKGKTGMDCGRLVGDVPGAAGQDHGGAREQGAGAVERRGRRVAL